MRFGNNCETFLCIEKRNKITHLHIGLHVCRLYYYRDKLKAMQMFTNREKLRIFDNNN